MGSECKHAPEGGAEDGVLSLKMAMVKRKIAVLSGKGGVGKSSVAANLAASLAKRGFRVGLLDADLHGPSIPTIMGVEGFRHSGGPLEPVMAHGVKVMSVGFLVGSADAAVVWRGPMKHAVIRQLLSESEWDVLDFLIVDCPPGTGDEPLSVLQSIEGLEGALVVSTPQKVAANDVRRSISFCHLMNVPALGVMENMSGFICPHCSKESHIFPTGEAAKMAAEMETPFLGSIPMDPAIAASGDAGTPWILRCPDSPAVATFEKTVDRILNSKVKVSIKMKYAIPVTEGLLSMHFGHCEQFAIFEVEDGAVSNAEMLTPPPHQPGLLPPWLAERGVKTVIAGGMGQRAIGLFDEAGIKVVTGAPAEEPKSVLEKYLNGSLATGANVCDH